MCPRTLFAPTLPTVASDTKQRRCQDAIRSTRRKCKRQHETDRELRCCSGRTSRLGRRLLFVIWARLQLTNISAVRTAHAASSAENLKGQPRSASQMSPTARNRRISDSLQGRGPDAAAKSHYTVGGRTLRPSAEPVKRLLERGEYRLGRRLSFALRAGPDTPKATPRGRPWIQRRVVLLVKLRCNVSRKLCVDDSSSERQHFGPGSSEFGVGPQAVICRAPRLEAWV